MSADFKIMEHIKSVLEQFGDRYIDNNNLKRYQVVEDLDNYNKELMQALLSDELIHNTYTEKVLDTEIFKLNQFVEMLEYKQFWQDSYTKYRNKIGLSTNGKLMSESDKVVLDFPYKDTLLKASMKEEKSNEKEDEIFLNEVLAKAELDEFEDPKFLVNAKRFDKDGEHIAEKFSDQDNLILKGNNLNALYSIKERYEGKIKLIYLVFRPALQYRIRFF